MKQHFTILLLIMSGFVNAQSWQSIPKAQSFILNPRQFTINPYTNDLWFVNDMLASMISSDGVKHQFSDELQGLLYASNDLNFTFTPLHTYFSTNVSGLFSFDEFIKTNIYPTSEVISILSNLDTIYVIKGNQGFEKFYNNNISVTNKIANRIAAKNSFFYLDIGTLCQITGPNPSDLYLMYNDLQYAGGPDKDIKFPHNSDTLFVCGKKGISYAYNYDFLDTIAPNNSIDMPSRNVREIEFDHLDRLWAVFADASNKPFALARYDNGTWVEKYDSTNCPIHFASYRAFEIDTLGNIWVVDNFNLHTLITPNSPQWLSTIELSNNIAIEVFPNPSSGKVNISSAQNLDFIAVYDFMGRLVYSQKTQKSKLCELNLSYLKNGNYVIEAHSGGAICREKVVLVD